MLGDDSHEATRALASYLASNRLKRSGQRDAVVDVFLRSGGHLSVEQLYGIVKRTRPDIGRTTVYRTLKLLQAAGLASELALGSESRWERDWKRGHHDHLICTACGEISEFTDARIERAQQRAAAAVGFVIEGHSHQIFGRCSKCVARAKRASVSSD